VAAGWKTVRVFISSNFRDMHVERDHLVRVVFPELKERCRTKHVQLVDVDLRWGVTEADAEHGKALDICLDEIDSCRPYFLGILGHRYGFVPEGHQQSITAQEIYHGVLHGSVPNQVVDLRKILEDQLEGQTLSRAQKDCLVRCYRSDADKRKHLLREHVAAADADIIRSVFERYSIYRKDRSFFFFRSEALSRQIAGRKTSDFFEQNQDDRDKLGSLKTEIVNAELPHFEYADSHGTSCEIVSHPIDQRSHQLQSELSIILCASVRLDILDLFTMQTTSYELSSLEEVVFDVPSPPGEVISIGTVCINNEHQ
jgi:hypothetical protein